MSKKYDLAIYIGRFQPFHIGHKHSVLEGLKIADRVLILVGSSNIARSPENPWTYSERVEFIKAGLGSELTENVNEVPEVMFAQLDDHASDTDWAANVQATVDKYSKSFTQPGHASNPRIVLIGHDKDSTTTYLKTFPQWHFFETKKMELWARGAGDETTPAQYRMSATEIRSYILTGRLDFVFNLLGSQDEAKAILNWTVEHSNEYHTVSSDYDYINRYKKEWSAAPYDPIFVTTDAVVVQSGHVLLVRRGGFPGKGLLALPGGFVNPNERLEDSMIRELTEETNIKMQAEVLRRCIKSKEVFDAPNRSQRGRTITHAYLVRLDDSKPLPDIKGGDDAASAHWYPLSEVRGLMHQFFEDHWFIIEKMISRSW